METIKRRAFVPEGLHLRANGEDEAQSRVIEGYAIVFNRASEPIYEDKYMIIREVIDPAAVTMELLNRSDIKLTMYHNREILLGRSRNGEGGLSYEIDENGVKFSCEMPNTPDGDTALELVSRGIITGCSFAFRCNYGDPACVTLTDSDTKPIERTARVMKIESIHDFTIDPDPYYEDTEVNLRAIIGHSIESETSEEINPINNLTPQISEMENEPMTPAAQPATTAPVQQRSLTEEVRDLFQRSHHVDITLLRRAEAGDNVVDTTAAAAARPTVIASIVDDVAKGLVYDKVGIEITHNNAGEYVWPVWGCGSVRIASEKEAVAPSKIDITSVVARPERLTVNYEVTYETFYQTANLIETIVQKALNLSLQRGLNTILLSPTKPEGSASLQGPFVGAQSIDIPAAYKYKDLIKLKAALLKGGVATNPVAVIHPVTACELEATPKDAGSGIMCLQDGRFLGYPVFISDAVGEGNIALGDWAFQAAGFFGDIRLIVDPYTKAECNMVRFTLNVGFGTATLRPEAFVIGKIKNA